MSQAITYFSFAARLPRSSALGRLNFRPAKRSQALGRHGFRPAKRSPGESCAILNDIEQRLLELIKVGSYDFW